MLADGMSNEGALKSDGSSPAAHRLTRARPKSQVSFRLPRPDREYDNDRLSQSDPCAIGSTTSDAPRNRRRLFRDMSYTSRAIRRDQLPRGRSAFFSSNSDGNDTISGSTQSHSHDDSKDSPRRAPRRQDSFRGKHRMYDTGQVGSPRFKTYQMPASVHRNNSSSAPEVSSQSINQYYIPPPEESNFSLLDAFCQLYSLAFGDVAMWVYGASFGKVLLFFLALYMAFVYCFVVLLYLVDKYKSFSACINGLEEGGELSTRAHLEFAFELSWTTFTTVGYGNVGPPPDIGCYPVRLVCSIEAILGMTYVSMCSGLFYAKLLRLLGRAPVTFSSTLCVQYGQGLEVGKTGRFHQPIYSKNFDARTHAETLKRPNDYRQASNGEVFYPFPVIEFRIVNNRANHEPGKNEIWDAEVTAIVQLSIENDPHENNEGLDEFQISSSSRWRPPTASKINDGYDKKSQKVYYKLALKPSFHPYFSRVWFLRHTLDATSPLLRREVRNMIKDRANGWDPSFDNYRDVRACLVEFSSLQIIMSGASALSRSEVYAEKLYSYEDICVGWRYIAVCYEDNSDKKGWQKCKRLQRKNQRKHFSYGDDITTRVDLSLIHDIVPQRGGDFEPVDD